MIGERVGFQVGPILLKCQPSGVYQMLDLVFKGQAFFGGVARGFPMVHATCVMIIPFWERMLVDLPGSYYGHLVGDEGRQEVFVHHWDRGEFWNWPWGKFLIALEPAPKWALPARRGVVGVGAWGASLGMGTGALGCTGAELEESLVRSEKLR